jgi:hypothetical protein
MHWTAGGNTANDSDRKSYHEIVEGDGDRVLGNLRPEANLSTADGNYVPHTRRFNGGAIGLAVAGMAGAVESPFKAGGSPINNNQLTVFAEMVAEYAETYDIEINRENVLTHAEVPITHGVAQPGKWDITWLPGMKRPGDPLQVGDRLREMVRAARKKNFEVAATTESDATDMSTEQMFAQILQALDRNRAIA